MTMTMKMDLLLLGSYTRLPCALTKMKLVAGQNKDTPLL